jgi:IS30 family transposase
MEEQAMHCYSHLTIEERESILVLKEKGYSLRSIAEKLRRSVGTISRELRRNSRPRLGYSADYARKLYRKRRRRCCRKRRFDEPDTREKVLELLNAYWSPEQICERLRKDGASVQIATSTIYRGIKRGLLPREIKKKLRTRPYHQPAGGRTGKLTIPHSIHDRPREANLRETVGHWESDTVQGSFRSGYIVTQVDRKSRYLVAAKIPNRKSELYMSATIRALQGKPVKTFTVDNGKEFARHTILTDQLGAEVYFCDPAAPGQRGTNENTNGLLRQFFPKRTRFERVSQADVDRAASRLNNRPRKCLDWETPHEVFSRECCT